MKTKDKKINWEPIAPGNDKYMILGVRSSSLQLNNNIAISVVENDKNGAFIKILQHDHEGDIVKALIGEGENYERLNYSNTNPGQRIFKFSNAQSHDIKILFKPYTPSPNAPESIRKLKDSFSFKFQKEVQDKIRFQKYKKVLDYHCWRNREAILNEDITIVIRSIYGVGMYPGSDHDQYAATIDIVRADNTIINTFNRVGIKTGNFLLSFSNNHNKYFLHLNEIRPEGLNFAVYKYIPPQGQPESDDSIQQDNDLRLIHDNDSILVIQGTDDLDN